MLRYLEGPCIFGWHYLLWIFDHGLLPPDCRPSLRVPDQPGADLPHQSRSSQDEPAVRLPWRNCPNPGAGGSSGLGRWALRPGWILATGSSTWVCRDRPQSAGTQSDWCRCVNNSTSPVAMAFHDTDRVGTMSHTQNVRSGMLSYMNSWTVDWLRIQNSEP